MHRSPGTSTCSRGLLPGCPGKSSVRSQGHTPPALPPASRRGLFLPPQTRGQTGALTPHSARVPAARGTSRRQGASQPPAGRPAPNKSEWNSSVWPVRARPGGRPAAVRLCLWSRSWGPSARGSHSAQEPRGSPAPGPVGRCLSRWRLRGRAQNRTNEQGNGFRAQTPEAALTLTTPRAGTGGRVPGLFSGTGAGGPSPVEAHWLIGIDDRSRSQWEVRRRRRPPTTAASGRAAGPCSPPFRLRSLGGSPKGFQAVLGGGPGPPGPPLPRTHARRRFVPLAAWAALAPRGLRDRLRGTGAGPAAAGPRAPR